MFPERAAQGQPAALRSHAEDLAAGRDLLHHLRRLPGPDRLAADLLEILLWRAAVTAGALAALYSILASLCRVAGGRHRRPAGRRDDSVAGAGGARRSAPLLMTLSHQFGLSVAAEIMMAVGMGVANAAVFKLVPQAVPQAVGGASGWVGGTGRLWRLHHPADPGRDRRRPGRRRLSCRLRPVRRPGTAVAWRWPCSSGATGRRPPTGALAEAGSLAGMVVSRMWSRDARSRVSSGSRQRAAQPPMPAPGARRAHGPGRSGRAGAGPPAAMTSACWSSPRRTAASSTGWRWPPASRPATARCASKTTARSRRPSFDVQTGEAVRLAPRPDVRVRARCLCARRDTALFRPAGGLPGHARRRAVLASRPSCSTLRSSKSSAAPGCGPIAMPAAKRSSTSARSSIDGLAYCRSCLGQAYYQAETAWRLDTGRSSIAATLAKSTLVG